MGGGQAPINHDPDDRPWTDFFPGHFQDDEGKALSKLLVNVGSILKPILGGIPGVAAAADRLERLAFAGALYKTVTAPNPESAGELAEAGAGLALAGASAGFLAEVQGAILGLALVPSVAGAAALAGEALGALSVAFLGSVAAVTAGAEVQAAGEAIEQANAQDEGENNDDGPPPKSPPFPFSPTSGFFWRPPGWARGFLPTIFFDPLVVNLTGNGAPNLTNVDSSTTTFDYFGNGFKTQTGWIGAGSGLLAYDPSGTGNITAANLLGSPTQSGVDALRALDSNGDGVINSSDPAYASLGVWIDANGDGVSQPGEFQSLASLGITSINLNFATTGNLTVNDNGNQILSTASYSLSNGNAGSISEVNFQVNTTNSTFTPPAGFTLDPATAALPELKGSGNVLDLATAMTLDPKLKAMVQAVNDNESNVLLKQYKNYRGNCNG